MLAILQYATSGFWTFVGCAILFGIAADAALRAYAVTVALVVGRRP
jgi:hypothetical protein